MLQFVSFLKLLSVTPLGKYTVDNSLLAQARHVSTGQESKICPSSMEDMCKNCAKCGKDFKIGTTETYNIKIKIRFGGISKIFCFCSHANMAASEKGISLKSEFLKSFYLTSQIKCNQWKELTKLI